MQKPDSFEVGIPEPTVTPVSDSPPPSTPLIPSTVGSTPETGGFPTSPPNRDRYSCCGDQFQLQTCSPSIGSPGSQAEAVATPPPPPPPESGSPHHEIFDCVPMMNTLPAVSSLNIYTPVYRPIRGQGYRGQVSQPQDGAVASNPPQMEGSIPKPFDSFAEAAWGTARPRSLSVGSGRKWFVGRRVPGPNRSPNLHINPGRECKFCKNNGEPPESYRSHVLRNPATGQLICNVLRGHVCEVCGATGDDAHTRNYCPKVKESKKFKYALPVVLKRTKHQSDGKVRTLDNNNNGRKHQ